MADPSNESMRAVKELSDRVGEVSMEDHPARMNGGDPMVEDIHDSELPNTLIVTNVNDSVFGDPNTKVGELKP